MAAIRHARPRRRRRRWISRLVAVSALAAVVVAAATAFGYGPVAHGVADALAYSLTRHAGAQVTAGVDACREDGPLTWRCTIEGGDGPGEYRVRLHGDCWSAARLGEAADATRPRLLSGCVELRDRVRLFDRLA